MALFLLSAPLRAQFDTYKYVVVPTHFEGYNKPNKYQTSTLIKYYLTENGYPAVYDNQQPTELRVEPCQGVFTRMHDTSGMFLTRVTLEFVDCEGNQVFQTMEGSSRLKDFGQAYKEAIQNAFLSFSGRTYSYHPPATTPASQVVPPTPPAARAEAAVAGAAVSVAGAEAAAETGQAALKKAAEQQPAPEADRQVGAAAVEGAEANATVPVAVAVAAASATEPETWYAQPIENGFQLVDSTPKVRMKLVNTSRKDTYIALVDGQAIGTVFLSDGTWVHEYFEGGTLFRQPLKIKF